MTATAARTTADIMRELGTKRERHAALQVELAETQRALREARSAAARALASGERGRTNKTTELVEQESAITDALELLAGEIGELEAAQRAAELRDASDEEVRLRGECVAAVDEMEALLLETISKTIVPAVEEMEKTFLPLRNATRRRQRLAGEGATTSDPVERATRGRGRMFELIRQLRAFQQQAVSDAVHAARPGAV